VCRWGLERPPPRQGCRGGRINDHRRVVRCADPDPPSTAARAALLLTVTGVVGLARFLACGAVRREPSIRVERRLSAAQSDGGACSDLHGSHAGEAGRGRVERTSLGQSCVLNSATTIEKSLGGAARSGLIDLRVCQPRQQAALRPAAANGLGAQSRPVEHRQADDAVTRGAAIAEGRYRRRDSDALG
jgi:hypothetical protein